MLLLTGILLTKAAGLILMGLFLAIGFNFGGLLAQKLNQKLGLVPL
jgi:hypothetical protein